MSWIVQSLLNRRTEIKTKSNSFNKEYRINGIPITTAFINEDSFDNETGGYTDSSFSSDEYNDLLLIEKAIKELSEKGVLNDHDLEIINFFGDSNTITSSGIEMNKDRSTISNKYDEICERIAFYMGGYFTNDGYIDYMCIKYNLSEEHENKLKNFIRSKYKHRIMRKTYNE